MMQLVAEPDKHLVDGDDVVFLRRQQGIEQRGLRGQELQPVSFDFSQFGEACVTGQPFLGKDALRPVIQLHILFPAAQCRQKFGADWP